MRINKLHLLSVLIALSGFAGCSGVKVTDTGQRGLFQGDGAGEVAGVRDVAGAPQSLEAAAIDGIELNPEITSSTDSGFVWPIRIGRVSSFFGKRKRDFHEGIDVRAPRGTPIFATKAGKVIYSSRRINGYGNMIVIKHDSHFASIYAHNKQNLVKVGDQVNQGQMIAFVGATGKATGPHLHFEVRKREVAVDPLEFLPKVKARQVASAKDDEPSTQN